ncbi:DNA-processing protein DprA [uncultured Cohaesibacter sp.]|uniref:DNA-processing protein DprA n=1 Tax=uncultured Cohaesibacter sp. TaxID=1002546 RepID=UPI0029C95A51|nr:DNA-processing protein DprA [uncultured Cohaesibacter sp.]
MALAEPGGDGYQSRAPLRLSEKQRFNWLRLIRCENVGPATFRDLINHFGSADKALKALPDLSRKGGAKRAFHMASSAEVEEEWTALHQAGARLVAIGEPDYPQALNHIPAPPPLLTVMGKQDIAAKPSVAIVGSRNCSASGAKLTEMIAHELGENGVVITSGLARGVDTHAHKASLVLGTIAVVAGGLNQLYPRQNVDLAKRIAVQGMLISEMPWNAPARAQDFPRRNRIISGIALGTLVVEAAKRSGSLITARYALEQGREVFAIPGSPLDPRASGTNHLIKEGATLVCEAQDILDALAAQQSYRPHQPSLPLRETTPDASGQPPASEPEETSKNRFIQSLSLTPIAIDDLVRQSSLTMGQVQLLLLELDLAGRLERHGNQTVSLKA